MKKNNLLLFETTSGCDGCRQRHVGCIEQKKHIGYVCTCGCRWGAGLVLSQWTREPMVNKLQQLLMRMLSLGIVDKEGNLTTKGKKLIEKARKEAE